MFLCAPLFAQESVPTLITVASDHAEVKSHIQLGFRDILLGWDEMARLHFRRAVSADKNCLLGWCGLMLTEGATEESRAALERILAGEYTGTPQETALLSTCLRLIGGDRNGAGEEFAERAAQFRNDILSACWAILLLHDGYEEIGGKPLPRQQQALDLSQQLCERRPDDALAAYLRGWVEESAPTPSDSALAAARHAAEQFPEHPSTQLLYGHLLFRNGYLKEAVSYLHRASELAENARQIVPHGTMEQVPSTPYPLALWPLELRAKLYESSLLWLNGQRRESLLIQRALLEEAASIHPEFSSSPGAILLHWEARTLPLRLLMMNPQLPSEKQITAAANAALPKNCSADEPLLYVRDCLRFCLVARQRAAAGKGSEALRCIQSAELQLKKLLAARAGCEGQGGYVLSAWVRAQEACQLALLAARAAAYPDTADVWLHSFEEQIRPASLLMPPVLPMLDKCHTK